MLFSFEAVRRNGLRMIETTGHRTEWISMLSDHFQHVPVAI
ncbi:MAG: hypothetical protein BWY31_04117 [Lentisphaerae bacterium ADurb.Bin242]|nr:MAG: hypothetical protein BWY31_04117 [Lentisphaerae bacterium ADurb.Bin242]